GWAMVCCTVLALAPGKTADTCTVGGVMSGYWATGRPTTLTTPAIVMTIDSTLAKIGRSMKKCEITASPSCSPRTRGERGAGQRTPAPHRGEPKRRAPHPRSLSPPGRGEEEG